MADREEFILGGRGLLYVQHWGREDAEKAVLLLHGAGEHAGRHAHLAGCLSAAGYWVIAPDHYGSGRSEGKRGHSEGFLYWVEDAKSVVEKYNLKKVIVFGHSMGGLIAAAFAIKYPELCARLILTSPFLGFTGQPEWLLKAVGHLGKVWPHCPLPNKIDAAALSRDSEVVRLYLTDPLVSLGMSAGWVREISRGQSFVREKAGTLACPLLVLAAGQDKLVNIEATEEFFKRAGSRQKMMQVFPDCYHELLNEPEKEEVMEIILNWLAKGLE